jgi:hypothetical protein
MMTNLPNIRSIPVTEAQWNGFLDWAVRQQAPQIVSVAPFMAKIIREVLAERERK